MCKPRSIRRIFQILSIFYSFGVMRFSFMAFEKNHTVVMFYAVTKPQNNKYGRQSIDTSSSAHTHTCTHASLESSIMFIFHVLMNGLQTDGPTEGRRDGHTYFACFNELVPESPLRVRSHWI